MGAGKHDGVGAAAIALDEAGRDLPRDGGILDRRAVELRLGEGGEPRSPDEGNFAAIGEIADQGVGIFALDRCLGAEHRNEPSARCRAGRLDRRHRPDEWCREPCPQLRQHQRRSGVAGDE